MPLQDIMNAPQSFGPSITERQDALDMGMAKGYADVSGSLAQTEMRNMQMDAAKKKQSLLENFQGDRNTPEFKNAMNKIDPEEVRSMEKHVASMDKSAREKATEYFDRVGAKVEMANTPELWAQSGINAPFEQRDTILGGVLTFKQVMDKRDVKAGVAGTSLMRNTKFLEQAGIPKQQALDLLLKSKQSGPDKFEQDLIKMFIGQDKYMGEDEEQEAIQKARRLTEHYFPDTAPPPAPGSKPQGFQSGAGPSSSGKDYTPYM